MLVLGRRIGEAIVIGKEIRLVVAAIEGDRVRLGICAPRAVRVDRQEVHDRRSLQPMPAERRCRRSLLSRKMSNAARGCPPK